jgi:hypothetical protein
MIQAINSAIWIGIYHIVARAHAAYNMYLVRERASPAGLPDFSWYMIPKQEKGTK